MENREKNRSENRSQNTNCGDKRPQTGAVSRSQQSGRNRSEMNSSQNKAQNKNRAEW